MKDSWQARTVRTIDLGYEQLLFLEGDPASHVRVQFRGVWLHDATSAREHGPQRHAAARPGAGHLPPNDLPGVVRGTPGAPVRLRWRRFGEALRSRLAAAAGLLAQPAAR